MAERKSIYNHPSSEKRRMRDEKPDAEPKMERKEVESKKDGGEAVKGMKDIAGRHHEERMALEKAHEAERRDLHGNHREEHRKMMGRHEKAHADLAHKQEAEMSTESNGDAGSDGNVQDQNANPEA